MPEPSYSLGAIHPGYKGKSSRTRAFWLVPLCTFLSLLGQACSYSYSPGPLSSQDLVEQYSIVTRFDLPPLDPVDNPEIRASLQHLVSTRRPFLEAALHRKQHHRDIIEYIFSAHGLPPELISVAVIESGFKPDATSPAGARGLWQFMPQTARAYGLEVSMFKDERTDIVKSSVAAARYLTRLYDRYQDWYLALAAYNCGPSRVNRAIQESNSRDFFEIARLGLLPRETINFVPQVVAAAILISGQSPG